MVGTIILVFIIGGIGGLGLVWWLKRKGLAEEVAETVKEGVDKVLTPKKPESDIDKIYMDLLQMNVKARTTKGYTLKMLEAMEVVIDKLADIIPKMNEKWPDATETWETARIATKHLPDHMAKYVVLDVDQLLEQENDFLKTMKTIETEIDEIIELHRTNALNEASTRDTVIDRKFEQSPSEGIL